MDLNQFIQNWMFSKTQEKFFRAYIEAVYFTKTGNADQPESNADLTHELLRQSAMDCNRFYNAYAELIGDNIEKAGHDFWLTRNGHGAGFWDRPEIYGDEAAAELTRACEFAGSSDAEFES